MRFDELYLSDDILDAIDSMHFNECTPIQEKTIPLITEGRDVIAVAQTGTGKTAAYLLPVIDEIANGDYPQDAINCIVMAPTRELAQQIDQQMQGFSYFMPVNSVAIYGGTDGYTFEQQKKGLKLGADVVIATPGRLIAHLSMGYVDLSKVSFLILDEADRMLDMGFYDDIMQIVKQLPKERQTLLFSATMPPKIKNLAREILNNPAEVKLAVSKPADKIDQSAYICYETQKIPILCHVFKQLQCDKSIVFASSKVKCKELCKALKGLNLSVGEMHSDLDQSRREDVLLDFKSGKIKILVATDIMARGIDIDDIGLVVNFDVPHENEDYVHRIGRTARANTDGIAITFVSDKEIGKFMKIEKFIEKEIKKNPIPEEIGEGPEYVEKGRKGQSGKKGDRKKSNSDNSGADKNSNKQKSKNQSKKSGKQQRAEEVVDNKNKSTQPADVEPKTDAPAVTEESQVAPEDANAETPKKKRKRRRSRKKKQNRESTENQTSNTDSETEVAEKQESVESQEPKPAEDKKKEVEEAEPEMEEKSVFDDRPVSYSLVAATMAAAARERAAREAAELKAREAEKLAKSAKTEDKQPEEAPAETAGTPKYAEAVEALEPAKKRRKRSNKKKKAVTDAVNTEPDVEQVEKVDETVVAVPVEKSSEIPEAKPAKKRSTKKKKAETTPEADLEQPENEQAEEVKPKRRTRKKSQPKEQPEVKEESAEPAEKTEVIDTEKPKRRRAAKKNAEEAADAAPEQVAEDKPKRRSRKKATTAAAAAENLSEDNKPE